METSSSIHVHFTPAAYLLVALTGILPAGVTSAAEPASSAVDRDFVSDLWPRSGSSYRRQIRALADGGAVVDDYRIPSVAPYDDFYHVQPDGHIDPSPARPVWTTSYYGQEQAIVAVLPDGSFVMATDPFRRDVHGAIISSFKPAPAALDVTQPISAAAQQSDGKLLFAQGTQLVRLLPTGAIDLKFSADTSALASISSINLDGSGRIIVGGTIDGTAAAVIRLLPSGASDATFHTITGTYVGAVTASGEVVGYRGYPRYDADGLLDASRDVRAWTTTADAVAIAPSGETYVGYSGLGIFRLTAESPPKIDPDFYTRCDAGATIEAMAVSPDGKLLVLGEFKSWEGFATSNLVRLDPSRPLTTIAPVVSVDMTRLTIRAGSRVVAQGRAIGTGPLTFTWSALDGGTLPADIHSPLLVFDSFGSENLDRYQLEVTGAGGTARATIDLRPTVAPRLINVSSRAALRPGDELIAGLSLEVPALPWLEYKLVLRGAGPALSQLGVANALPNPVLTLVDGTGATVQENDDWADSGFTRNWTNLAGAFPFTTGSRDSLLVVDARGGNYTLMLRDATGAGGTALIEAYNVDQDDPLLTNLPRGALTNTSLRGRTGAAADPLIASFVINDPAGFARPMRVLVRVVGPALADFGVSSPLADPRLAVFDTQGRAIARNDDWSNGANPSDTAAAAARAGAFPLPPGGKDAALVLDLPAGAYTVQAAGSDTATGIALIEIYRVP